MLSWDRYHLPTTLAEALTLWRAAPEGARLVAGATDLLPWARQGRAGDVRVPAMIDVTRVDELQGWRLEGPRVRLGANVVFQDFLEDARLAALLPCMPGCAVWFADDQIRNQATLVGNLINASPAADGTPPVVAMNGEMEVARLEGETIARRTLPVERFIAGPGRTDLRPGEIAVSVSVDAMPGYGGAFHKVGHRRSLVISKVCAAALARTDESGERFEDVRLALGGIAPAPVRAREVEDALRGARISAAAIARAAAAPPARVASRTRREYRRAVVEGFVAAALEDAAAEARRRRGAAERKEADHA